MNDSAILATHRALLDQAQRLSERASVIYDRKIVILQHVHGAPAPTLPTPGSSAPSQLSAAVAKLLGRPETAQASTRSPLLEELAALESEARVIEEAQGVLRTDLSAIEGRVAAILRTKHADEHRTILSQMATAVVMLRSAVRNESELVGRTKLGNARLQSYGTVLSGGAIWSLRKLLCDLDEAGLSGLKETAGEQWVA